MSEDIFFNIDARCDFDEFQAFFGQFKHAAFRDVEDVFAVAGCIGTVESDLVDSFDELLGFAFLEDLDFAVFDSDFQAASRKGAAEVNIRCLLGNIRETAAAGNVATELADVDVARCIALSQTEVSDVQTAAIVEVELIGVVDDSIGIAGRTETSTALRYATDGATFDGQGNGIGDTFFTGNGSNVFRSTDAEVDDSVFSQFQSAAAADDFLSAHGESCVGSAFRSTMFTAEGRIIFAVIRLLMVFRSCYDDVVDIDTRDFDHARVEAAVSNDVFDLDDDFTATVVDGLGDGSAFERPDFFVHGDVARFIGISTAEESYVDREGRVEKLFVTVDFDQLDQVFFGYVIPAVIDQVEISNALVIQLANLAQSIAKAAGDSDGAFIRDAAKEQAYFALDMPFRSWLAGIDPAQEKLPEAEERWWKIAQPIVRRLGAELIAQAGPQALVGREVDQKNIAAPDAYNYFLYRTKNEQTLKNGGKKSGK